MAPRFTSGAGMSLLITFGLLFIMQALVAVDEIDLPDPTTPLMLEIVRLIEDTPIIEKNRVPDKPEPPPVPPTPQDSFIRPGPPSGDTINVIEPFVPAPPDGPFVARGDSNEMPLVRVDPVYPTRLAARGIEGWVEVEFSIGKTGDIVDPRIIQSSNPGFDRAALRAVRRWRYNPRLEDGQPVTRDGIRVRLTFALDKATV